MNQSHEAIFFNDVKRGSIGEQIFREDFLDFLGINHIDVSGSQKFQALGVDLKTDLGFFEVKSNYRNNHFLNIEDFSNFNEELGPIKKGWFYTTKAKVLVFVSPDTRAMIIVPFTMQFKCRFESLKHGFQRIPNKISRRGDAAWQSSFILLDLNYFEGFFTYYKKDWFFENGSNQKP